MDSESHAPVPAPGKALAYWRKNYLFGIARPVALVVDGSTFTCLDNQLAPVFSSPLSALRIRRGFGIFKVDIEGARAGYLTPTGGTPSPEPSAALLQFLQQRPADDRMGAAASLAAGAVIADAVGDAVGQAFATVGYIAGTKALGEFLASVGVPTARDA